MTGNYGEYIGGLTSAGGLWNNTGRPLSGGERVVRSAIDPCVREKILVYVYYSCAASLCRVLLIASSLFALCVPVLAGSYVARYSGTPSATSNTCSLSSVGECKVVATMVWTPDPGNPAEPPPKSAIISVSGNARAGGYGHCRTH